jgi:L-glyceraldehyde 3-phosphate reductase
MPHAFRDDRYSTMTYRRCGASGLLLPAVSLGLWHNFGDGDDFGNAKRMCFFAFDRGVTHFDIANNYGPPPGSAERAFGKIVREMPRDELIVSSKAGYLMWPGPYGDFGSRKYIVASCDQSLRRTGLDYFDIFYHHRPDAETPLDETMAALEQLVRQGKALYAGISNYSGKQTARAAAAMKKISAGSTPILINQSRSNLYQRSVLADLLPVADRLGIGVIIYSPLAQGLLTDRYLKGVPKGSRALLNRFLKKDRITESYRAQARALDRIASARGQSLAQMALAWLLRDKRVTSVLIGASSVEQIKQDLGAMKNVDFSREEMRKIDAVCGAKK